jgi:hypothetical protein
VTSKWPDLIAKKRLKIKILLKTQKKVHAHNRESYRIRRPTSTRTNESRKKSLRKERGTGENHIRMHIPSTKAIIYFNLYF